VEEPLGDPRMMRLASSLEVCACTATKAPTAISRVVIFFIAYFLVTKHGSKKVPIVLFIDKEMLKQPVECCVLIFY
jgi:hypothetical protein